ncbi:MAG: oxygen-independent coproporphyrinogen III oxidase, partial [Hyphomicrobiales bacterium]
KYSSPVPRYTSYPTAPHFHDGVSGTDYAQWLETADPAGILSLYFHIPYCDTLCWFCGCHTKMTRRYDPVAAYLPSLHDEIAQVSEALPSGPRVNHIHWGGGSPTILEPEDIRRLAMKTYEHFNVGPQAEFAVEIDPRGFDPERIRVLAEVGVTRASIGVQDFDPKVQSAINRRQSFEETRQVVAWLRDAGIAAVNLDIMYGLPHQTTNTIVRTVEQVIALAPDRIALFGYGHVPWMKRHQSMIDEAALPDVRQRFAQASRAAELLTAAGYRTIGLDHFARPEDTLAQAARDGTLRRNFQGYTADAADALLGFGASAIGSLPQGYCQNTAPISDYRNRVADKGLATVRGIALGPDDKMRRWVIERLMCDLALSSRALRARFGQNAECLLGGSIDLDGYEHDDLIARGDDGFRVTAAGRPFIRAICAEFDAYLKRDRARHSVAV